MSDEPNRKRAIVLRDRRTSVSLEDAFWFALQAIAAQQQITLTKLIEQIAGSQRPRNLSSALRVAVLRHYRADDGLGDAEPLA